MFSLVLREDNSPVSALSYSLILPCSVAALHRMPTRSFELYPNSSLFLLHPITRFPSLLVSSSVINLSYNSVAENIITIFAWTKRWSFMVITNATVSVDSFFVLSGLLTCYLFLKELDKKHMGVVRFLTTVPIMWLHRYIR